MKKLITGWLLVAVGVLNASVSKAATEGTQDRLEEGGVVVEEVEEGSVLAKAGLQAGDLLLSWERLANPPANPDGARGELKSPFDWMWLEVEHVPRGKIRLSGEREGQQNHWLVDLGWWKARVRPRLSEAMLESYLRGLELIEEGQLKEGIDALRQIVEVAREDQDWRLRCWLFLRMGEELAKERAWDDSQASYQRALEQAQDPLSQVAIWEAIGEASLQQDEFDKAQEAFRSALIIRDTASGESLGVARSKHNLGNVALHSRDLKSAEAYYQQALTLRERMAPESLALAASFNNLGILAFFRGDLVPAESLFKQALALREDMAPESLDLATNLNNLGNVAATRGDVATAERFYQAALALREKLDPESLDVATSLNNLGNISVQRGDLATAEAYHQRALILREKLAASSLDMSQSYNNLGAIKEAQGYLASAETYYQRALTIWEKLVPDNLDVARGLSNLGNIAMLRGDLTTAEARHHKALAIREEKAPNSLELADSYTNSGILARRRGDLLTAEKYYRNALAIRKEFAPDSTQMAAIFTNLGNVFWKTGNLKTAEAYYQRALVILNNLAPDSLGMAANLNNMAEVALDLGDMVTADAYHQRALSIRNNLAPESLDVATSFNNLGNLAMARGDLLEAVDYQQRALAIWESLAPNSTGEAGTLHSLGVLFNKKNKAREAADFLSRAIAALEGQIRTLGGSHELQGSFRAQHREIYRDSIEVLLEANRYDEAFFTLERFRARSLLTMIAERDIIFTADLPADLEEERRRVAVRHDRALKEMKALSQADDKEKVKVLQAEIEALYRERGKLIARIRRESPKLAALQYPQPLGVEEIKEFLDPGTALLSYSIGERQVDLFVITHEGGLETHSLPYGETELRRNVASFLGDLERARNPRHELFKGVMENGRKLYDMLIQPVSDALETHDRLLILPDGPLHNLPFGALVRITGGDDSDPERDWQYLIEWKPVHYALSATVYAELRKTRQDSTNGTPPLLAAFGAPSYNTELTEGVNPLFNWNPLPYSREEVFQIAGLYKSVQTYLGEGSTEEHVKSIRRDVDIIHLAVHGHLDDRFPLNSALVFTLPKGFPEDRANGLLEVWEIFESVRIDADLVTLSTCQSAIGEEQGGEGLIGLTRAFQYAGARSVAATLWSVNDRASAELMVRFYKHLTSGKTKDQALRMAQLELTRGPIKVSNDDGAIEEVNYSAPYYWAGFQLYGDWR